MKLLCILLVTLLSSNFLFANKVDDLKTDDDVAKFIVSLDSNLISKNNSPKLVINSTEEINQNKSCTGLPLNWGLKNWQKVDFNNDGLTDLFAIALWYQYTTFVAIDLGGDKFKLIRINYSTFESCEVSKIIKSKFGTLLLFHTNKPDIVGTPFRRNHPETDTLIYKFGAFVELNKKSAKYKIDTIIFHSGMCLGTCPDFEIKITKNGKAEYKAGFYSKKQGLFKADLAEENFKEIKNLLNYINIKSLRNNYDVSWTDSPTCTIYIKFSDGSVKKIRDYGELGTFGLREVYNQFFQLTTNQYWIAQRY
jgi:hypothetical protein